MRNKLKVLVILGPTASGKSALAIELAKHFNGEVVSADSRQVYKGMDIGTGKVTKREMRGVPHHLLDVASPKTRLSVAEYQAKAYAAISDIHQRGKLPIICGGTGLYVSSITDGTIFPEVPPDEKLRARLDKLSAPQLYDRLRKLDPKRAKTIDKNNPRRLVRAIEIAMALGNVPAPQTVAPKFDMLIIGAQIAPETLKKRIHSRLLSRIKQGMLAEAKKLHVGGLSWKRMEELGLEYRYLARHLRGTTTKPEFLEQLEREIVRYAKRQMTWFKRDNRIVWVPYDDQKISVGLVKKFLSV